MCQPCEPEEPSWDLGAVLLLLAADASQRSASNLQLVRALSEAPAPAVKEPDRLSSLPHDLVSLVLDAVSEHDMRSLAVVSFVQPQPDRAPRAGRFGRSGRWTMTEGAVGVCGLSRACCAHRSCVRGAGYES